MGFRFSCYGVFHWMETELTSFALVRVLTLTSLSAPTVRESRGLAVDEGRQPIPFVAPVRSYVAVDLW